MIYPGIYLLLLLLLLLIAIAFFTVGERKLMGAIQRRKGPDVVGFWGVLQPMADGLKLVVKELIFPLRASIFLFFSGPIIIFILSLFNWIIIPFNETAFFSSIFISVLFTFVISSLNIYGLILAGWASNSRYAFLGAIRSAAQMISYELIFGLINIIIILLSNSYNYAEIIYTQQYSIFFFFPLFPIFIIYLIVMLAETNRTPFDLAEAEAELVAGYNVEYSSMLFAFFFLGEYANMLLLSILGVIYFFGGWSSIFSLNTSAVWLFGKTIFFCIFFVWIRATLPRYRYDQLMFIGWKVLLPLCFGLFCFYTGVLTFLTLYF